ncbi:hypothetical protein QQ008_06100 [Fulvivirgaceae bacterium BMA10]|uniref:Uncharacterized protein n=1 Tax=Splendidivirga corallicola TaxID=3051826 RepID=A0ABT8KJN8_9BACT|nr:hypothetical protein [Fulvivirgaceae bacterium BMA10]
MKFYLKIAIFTGIVLIMLGTLNTYGKDKNPANGFYLIDDSETKVLCAFELKLNNREVFYCLPPKPLIAESEFSSITNIHYDNQKDLYLLMIKLTPLGTEVLKKTIAALEGRSIGLVVKRKLVTIIRIRPVRHTDVVMIGEGLTKRQLQWIRAEITRNIKLAKKE